jgi:hypothetical protein
MKNMATISFFTSNPSKSIYDMGDGMVEIMHWKEGTWNEEMVSKKPIWEILKGKNLFDFTLGETIEIPLSVLNKNFTKIED